jgi:glutathione peroxidase
MCPCCPWLSRLALLALVVAGVVLIGGCGCDGGAMCGPAPAADSENASCPGDGSPCCELASKGDALQACPACPVSASQLAAVAEDNAVVPYFEVGAATDETPKDKGGAKVPGVLNFSMKTLDGKPAELSRYQGKVVLFVNVASQCGLTPQYKELEALHEKYADKGLSIVGVPANNFGSQEPGSNDEIAEFCKKNYGVKFDMLARVSVKGGDKCELYKFLTSKDTNPKFAGEVTWNFEKFLVGRSGEVVARFKPTVKPDAKEIVTAIETELGKK